MENYGILSLLPVAVVIILVFVTRRTAASLLCGAVVGSIMLYGKDFAMPLIDVVYGVMGSSTWIWLVLVCGFFGSLVALFEASGGIFGFTNIASKVCTTEKRTLFGAWLLGVIVFIDDWLSILSVGAAMRNATDRLKIPREMLAFVSNSVASSVCVIVPISTWGVFMISQMTASGVCTAEVGMATFLKTLPLMFYPLMALLCSLLFAVGILPKYGPMKKAYALARSGEAQNMEQQEEKKGNALNFLVPIILITAITIATGEILYGTLFGLVFCAVLYLPQKLMTLNKFMDSVVSGFKDMVGVFMIVTSAFTLRDINSLLGMPEYVIGAAKAALSPELLPVAAFLIVTALGVAAGNFWGICAISFPVIIPIAVALGGNIL
ncbi:MAG: hypothetical protein IKB65_07260, partial [Ruminiclostridium sp.]|nr:hypothetical protein [Ruminiclostridium sp.]